VTCASWDNYIFAKFCIRRIDAVELTLYSFKIHVCINSGMHVKNCWHMINEAENDERVIKKTQDDSVASLAY